MTQSSQRGRRTPAPATTTATRGVIVVVIAAFIGFILLVKGGGGSTEGTPSNELPKVTAPPTTATPTTGVPPATSVPPAQLKVLVANGTTTKGLAGKTVTTLKTKGYTSSTATDAPQTTTSQVYFVAGTEAEAKAVAAALGLPAARVAPMPGAPPVTVGQNKVLVLLGPDAPAAGAAAGATTTTTTKPA
jgi:hypothetical protein